MSDTCDRLVVGAGSAGCALAARLSEVGSRRVLLVAGTPDRDPWIYVPLGYGKLFGRRDIDWAYESEPEPALGGRRIFSPRGKVLGGYASVGGLVCIRGRPEDYDRWGAPGWRSRGLLPYFRKSEDRPRGANDWHRAGGPLARCILLDRGRAVGVEYELGGARRTAREVILAAGAFDSPRLLQLSGVGPKNCSNGTASGSCAICRPTAKTCRTTSAAAVLARKPAAHAERRRGEPVAQGDNRPAGSALSPQADHRERGLRRGVRARAAGNRRRRTRRSTSSVFRARGAAGRCIRFPASRPRCRNFGRNRAARCASAWPTRPSRRRSATTSRHRPRPAGDGLEGLKLIGRTAAARLLGDDVAGEHPPGERVRTDADGLAFLRESGDTVFHPSSTCRVGTDARAVLDPQLRVRGLGACAWWTPR